MGLFSSGIGIDVSDHHVRIVLASFTGKPTGLFELTLPHGLIVDDHVVKPVALRKALDDLIVKSGLQDLHAPTTLLVPESRIFAAAVEVSPDEPNDAIDALARRAGQKAIPIPFSQAIVTVSRERMKKGDNRLAVYALQNDVIKPLVSVFGRAQFPLIAAESNSLALFRVYERFAPKEIRLQGPQDAVLIVDVGHRWTNFTVFDRKGLTLLSRSIALRKLTDTSKGITKKLTKESADKICWTIQDTLAFFAPKGIRVMIVLLAGVEGFQKDIATTCKVASKTVPIERMGDVLSVPEMEPNDVHVFGSALGAALRSIRPGSYKHEHNFLRTEEV